MHQERAGAILPATRLVTACSMVAAARELNVSPPAITQRLQQIESRYGIRLVDRSTRRMQLTDEGEPLYEKGAVICAEAAALLDQLAARSGAVTGHLRVSARFGFGRRHLAPLVADFMDVSGQSVDYIGPGCGRPIAAVRVQ